MKSILAWIAFLISMPGAAPTEAQSPGDFRPFAKPADDAFLICRVVPPGVTDSRDIVLEFHDDGDTFTERVRIIAYDSTGTPLFLALHAIARVGPGKGLVHGFVIQFSPIPFGAHGTLDESQQLPKFESKKQASKERLPQGWRETTADDLRLARELAVFSWERRCGRSRPTVGVRKL
jgi:hypothetical protein